MSKSFLFGIFFLLCLQLYAQPKSATIRGEIRNSENNPIEGVHIQNLHTETYAISDTNGEFSLKVSVGNTLQITHVSYQTVYRTILENDISFRGISVKMNEQINEIEGVEVSKYQKIDARELGIIQHEVKELTFNEKRVISASSSGGGLIIGLLNKITGRTKMLKKIVANDTNLAVADYITTNFSEYLQKELKANEEDISLLAYFVMEEPEYHQAVSNKQDDLLRFMLVDSWLEYRNMLKEAEKSEELK